MIDIHTHILPGLDDGAQDEEISCAMLQTEQEQGIHTVVFTPHYYGRISPEQFIEKRQNAFARLQGLLPDGIQTRFGAEVYFTGVNVPDFDVLCTLAIEGTNYILFEFPFMLPWTSELFEKLSDFIDETGYTPIIAHAERYHEVMKNPALITQFIQMGCLIQLNARAFLSKYERKFAFALLKHGLVHCIASDAHDTALRAPDLEMAKKAIEKAGYAKEWLQTQAYMRGILNGEKITCHATKKIKRVFGNYF